MWEGAQSAKVGSSSGLAWLGVTSHLPLGVARVSASLPSASILCGRPVSEAGGLLGLCGSSGGFLALEVPPHYKGFRTLPQPLGCMTPKGSDSSEG